MSAAASADAAASPTGAKEGLALQGGGTSAWRHDINETGETADAARGAARRGLLHPHGQAKGSGPRAGHEPHRQNATRAGTFRDRARSSSWYPRGHPATRRAARSTGDTRHQCVARRGAVELGAPRIAASSLRGGGAARACGLALSRTARHRAADRAVARCATAGCGSAGRASAGRSRRIAAEAAAPLILPAGFMRRALGIAGDVGLKALVRQSAAQGYLAREPRLRGLRRRYGA